MLKYKNILVPYDGSAHAKKAMAQAADLAAAGEGTKLYIVSVCNMVSAMSNFDQVSIAEGCLTSKLSEDLEAQCRLIVMGSRGLGPLKGIFMGSVSSYIVSRGKYPVLIVK